MIKLRLQRKGRKRRPYYHIVVADNRSPRDGRIIEQIGRYDNVSENKHVIIDESRAMHWLDVGAQPTDKVRNLLKGEGILLKRHLQRWGKTEEEIEAALAEWKKGRDERRAEVMTRKEQLAKILEDEEKTFKDKLVKKAKEAKEAAEAPKKDEGDAPVEATADLDSDAKASEEEAAVETAEAEATTEEAEKGSSSEEAKSEDTPAEEVPAKETPAEEPKSEDAPAEEESKKDAPEA
ncbi:MAG: 30S ribosomal protein S16 [Balneolaceae bacterium]|nr:30S ribosomal protein S16 [Balneolaceae bacterium]MDR9446432.1 30S ribosomal protein S16 [Balneolaceae bacterium]